ncbi:MAG: baseplate J/gp47 family protein [Victivallaceae bacterium]|nr:baseplate J/gp47 family protein [Victivallaceae bacterium]
MIDKSNFTAEEKLFFDSLVASGVPADEAAFRAQMQALADLSHLPIANPSKYSAFWNFIQSAVAEPFRAIVRELVTVEMPGFYAKTATGSRLDLIAWGVGIERKPAVKATGKLTFSRASGVAGVVEIPIGTRVRTIAISGNVYRMITTAAAVIAADAAAIEVMAEAENPGENYNLSAGYYSIMDSDVPRAGGVTNASGWLVTPGADEESDEELRLRIRDRFLAAGDWHTDAKYRAMISGRAGIRSDRCYFDHSNPRGPGSADCYIIFESGTTPATYLADLNSYIMTQGNHGHGDDLVCKAIPETTYDLTCTVRLAATTATARRAVCLAEIENIIKCAFWGNSDYEVERSWPYSTFSFSRLAAELHAAIPELLGVTFSRGDITSELDLPKLGTLTVQENQ